MLGVRRFEEAVFRLYADKHFTGHYHLYIGQEATGVGAIRALSAEDMIFTTHRNHGHLIARGADPAKAFAEILGRADGLLGGRGGTFHLADPAHGVPHTSALVGGCTALAVGAAHAFRSFGEKRVAVVFFGDGALEEGVTFEALNIASLWRLPVVFVCENNSPGAQKQGPDANLSRGSLAAQKLAAIPKSLSLGCRTVDGIDAKAVFGAVARARDACIAGNGPVFIETVTPGWIGNAGQWPEMTTGVTRIELAWDDAAIPDRHRTWYERGDPVLRFCREAIAAGHLSPDEAKSIDAAVRQRIEAAADAALASPMPAADAALAHVFA
jgi:pyruvate dehydrogenase E1 component alpha subunit